MNKVYLDCTRPFGESRGYAQIQLLEVLLSLNGFVVYHNFGSHFSLPTFCSANGLALMSGAVQRGIDQHRLSPTLEGDQVGSAPLVSDARGVLSGISTAYLEWPRSLTIFSLNSAGCSVSLSCGAGCMLAHPIPHNTKGAVAPGRALCAEGVSES